MLYDCTGDQTKGAQKGITKHTHLEYEDYLTTLYENQPLYLPQRRMQYDRSLGKMTIIETKKAGLNPNYTKMYLHDNMVSISPLKRDGQYI